MNILKVRVELENIQTSLELKSLVVQPGLYYLLLTKNNLLVKIPKYNLVSRFLDLCLGIAHSYDSLQSLILNICIFNMFS